MSAAAAPVSSSSIDLSRLSFTPEAVNVLEYANWSTAPLGNVVQNRLKGKVALVTGASAGMGAVTARRLAAEGAKVLLLARREEKLSELVAAIKKSGGDAAYIVGDASTEEDQKKAVDLALSTFGGLHIAFNNAGLVLGYGQKSWEVSADIFLQQQAVNVNSVFFGVKYQGPAIAHSGGGVIINNASASTYLTSSGLQSIYPASKTWVVSYTMHCANALGKFGVRINSISPGMTLTDIAGGPQGHGIIVQMGKSALLGRVVKPQEIAATVAFLASDEAHAITGIDILVDGGARVADKK